MQFHDALLVIIAFISEFIGTLSGFGSSTFFVPLALLIEDFHFVLALTAILHCFGNIWRILIFKKNFHSSSFFLLIIPIIFFTGLGAVLTTRFSPSLIQNVLGCALIGISILRFFENKFLLMSPKWFAVVLSIFSGFFTGFVGTGGVLRGLALTALQLPKSTFVMTSASVDLGGDLLRAIIYLKNGYMDWNQWFYIPLLGTAAFIGAQLGKKVIDRLNQKQFERIVTTFVFLSGLLMLINTKE